MFSLNVGSNTFLSGQLPTWAGAGARLEAATFQIRQQHAGGSSETMSTAELTYDLQRVIASLSSPLALDRSRACAKLHQILPSLGKGNLLQTSSLPALLLDDLRTPSAALVSDPLPDSKRSATGRRATMMPC